MTLPDPTFDLAVDRITALCVRCNEPFKIRKAPSPSVLCKLCRRLRDREANRARVQKHRANVALKAAARALKASAKAANGDGSGNGSAVEPHNASGSAVTPEAGF